jgi:hypothetical protein
MQIAKDGLMDGNALSRAQFLKGDHLPELTLVTKEQTDSDVQTLWFSKQRMY